MNSDDLMRLGPAAQKQVMEKMRKPGKYKAQKTRRGKLTFDSKKEAEQSAARSAPEQLKKREKKEHTRTGRQGMLEI